MRMFIGENAEAAYEFMQVVEKDGTGLRNFAQLNRYAL